MATAKAKVKVGIHKRAINRFFQCNKRRKMEKALKKVKSELGREYPMWIGGKKVITAGKKEVHEPVAAIGSDWRVPGCVEGPGGRGD